MPDLKQILFQRKVHFMLLGNMVEYAVYIEDNTSRPNGMTFSKIYMCVCIYMSVYIHMCADVYMCIDISLQ